MSIAVINIRDLIKYILILGIIGIVIASGIIIVKGREELKPAEAEDKESSSFLYCLGMEIPIMSKDEDMKEDKKAEASGYKMLDTQLAMMSNLEEDDHSKEDERNEEIQEEQKVEEEPKENKKIEVAGGVTTQVINENNITASFTDQRQDIQIKNQSKYDVKDILENPHYELKNKNKVLIYHTHTCESYTSSEKYGYEMTGAYRTTDLNFTVSKVRRRIRGMLKTIWKNSCS